MGARTLNGRSLASIQQTELDSGVVRHASHHTIKRVDLTNQMSLTETTDRRIARHHPDVVFPHRNQKSVRASPCGRMRCLRTCMTRADDDHIRISMFHVKHSYFPRQKFAKTSSSTASTST